MRIRKQVYELTVQDLDEYPAWEFALDEECEEGQDEATVRPYLDDEPVDPTAAMFVVRTRFVLADGSVMVGYLTPPVDEDDDLGVIQPIIVTDGGQIEFWHGRMVFSDQDAAQAYSKLGKNADDVFPIKFETTAKVEDGAVQGVLEGFMCYEDDNSDTVRLVR